VRAQQIVQDIRQQLGDFNFHEMPQGYNQKNRIFKPQQALENGARYEGEWND